MKEQLAIMGGVAMAVWFPPAFAPNSEQSGGPEVVCMQYNQCNTIAQYCRTTKLQFETT
jgi:hypothetical protein